MKATTSPVLSSIKPADKTTTDSPEQPAEEAKVSSVAETVPATESNLTDYQSILKQIDEWAKDKFLEPHIRLTGKLTSEELSELNQKIISVSENWRAEFTFEEYKAYLVRYKGIAEYQPPSMHEFFNKLKSDGLKWTFTIAFETEDTETIDFIVMQLKSARVRKLKLEQHFSEKQMDAILHACKNHGLECIHFLPYTMHGIMQRITDKQANILLECLQHYNLKYLVELPGNKISEVTAGELASFAAKKEMDIRVIECPFFDKRTCIESTIQYPETWMHDSSFHTYTSADIKRLGAALKTQYGHSAHREKKSRPPELTLIITTHKPLGNTDDWVTFFTTLLDSDVNITELRIREPIIEHKIMIAILTGLSTNRTIKILYVKMPKLMDLEDLIEENEILTESLKLNSTLTSIKMVVNYLLADEITKVLATHPALTSLTLKRYLLRHTSAGKNLKKLLTNTKTMHHLAITHCHYGEDIIAELSEGLEKNNTLRTLILAQLTNTEMCMLARAFSHNQSLTKFSFDSSAVNREITVVPQTTPEGLYKFTRILQASHFLKQVTFEWPEAKTEKKAEHQELLKRITHENTEKWIRDKRQPYVDALIVLFQACHGDKKHFLFSMRVYLDAILPYLVPPADAATPAQTDRCTRLVRENMRCRAENISIKKSVANNPVMTPLENSSDMPVEQERKHQNPQEIKWKTSIPEQVCFKKYKFNAFYQIFEKWNDRKDDEIVYPDNSVDPSPLDTKKVPHENPVNSPLDPNNAMTVDHFYRVLDTYKSTSLLNWCCCWGRESKIMQKLRQIQPNEEKRITRDQVEQVVSKDSLQRLNFFNNIAGAAKGNKGTDDVIEKLKQHLNF